MLKLGIVLVKEKVNLFKDLFACFKLIKKIKIVVFLKSLFRSFFEVIFNFAFNSILTIYFSKSRLFLKRNLLNLS